MNNYLDYDDDNDCFSWGGTPNDLKKFINDVLEVDVENRIGEPKEDKTHNAFSYKVKDYSTTDG